MLALVDAEWNPPLSCVHLCCNLISRSLLFGISVTRRMLPYSNVTISRELSLRMHSIINFHVSQTFGHPEVRSEFPWSHLNGYLVKMLGCMVSFVFTGQNRGLTPETHCIYFIFIKELLTSKKQTKTCQIMPNIVLIFYQTLRHAGL